MTATTSSTIRRTVTSGDAEIYVEQRGTGPDVLLLCGLGDTIEVWDAQIEALSDRYRLTTYDNRGVGRTVADIASITVPALAADAAAVVEAMGLDRPHVMGFSGGGMLAQELALSRPELVRSLVLCGTFCEFDGLMHRKALSWQALGATAESSEDFLRGFLAWIYTREAHADGRVDAWIREMAAFEPQMTDEAFATTLAAYAGHSTKARLGRIGVPTLVVCGDEDLVCPPYCGRDIAALVDGAELVVMEGQAHQPFQEVPEAYNALVAGFWERVAS